MVDKSFLNLNHYRFGKGPHSHLKYSWRQNQLRRKGKLVVTNSLELKTQLLKLYHDTSTGGHFGVLVIGRRLGSLVYWKGMWKMVREYIRQCSVCEQNKYETLASSGILQPLPSLKGLFTDITMDFIEGLPNSKGKPVIMVVVDRLSKYAHFISLSHTYNAKQVAQVFLDNVYKLNRLSETIVNDRNFVFTSQFWQEFFKLQGVSLHLSTAYHPQSDGQS